MLEVIEVSRRFSDRHVLRGVSMTVNPGDRVGLVGVSGVGKSLLLRTIAMQEPLESGQLRWRGEVVSAEKATAYRADVMYVRQTAARFEGTVEQWCQLPYQLSIHSDKSFDRDEVLRRIAMVGRDESFLAQSHGNLSGGEAQLAAIICATQLSPSVLLLDEPTSALDAATAMQVEDLIADWFGHQPDQRASVWVTHGMQQAARNCDRILQIQDGQLQPVDLTEGTSG